VTVAPHLPDVLPVGWKAWKVDSQCSAGYRKEAARRSRRPRDAGRRWAASKEWMARVHRSVVRRCSKEVARAARRSHPTGAKRFPLPKVVRPARLKAVRLARLRGGSHLRDGSRPRKAAKSFPRHRLVRPHRHAPHRPPRFQRTGRAPSSGQGRIEVFGTRHQFPSTRLIWMGPMPG
jgi:hypothetical protein